MHRDAVTDEDFQQGARVGADPAVEALRPREPTASCGFGSPGSDFTVRRIDLNGALIRHPQATFVLRASGDAMAGAGVDPRLEGRPLVVLSSNDGACIARSNEAKAFGVKMAQPCAGDWVVKA